jgi:spermidine synthase
VSAQPTRRERRRARRDAQHAERQAEVQPAWVLPALALAFLLSGAAGLMHEVVWARLMGLLFGATALAISTVLAAYMGGLALGSWWIGTRTDRLRDCRRAYALLEIGIGCSAVAVPLLLGLAEPLYGWVWRRTQASFATFSLLRLLIALAILIGPTVLMGATLPVLAEYCAGLRGRRMAPQWLYTVNLAGAVLGVAAAGFVVMPALGVWGTILFAAAVNVGVGIGVLALPPLAAVPRTAVQADTAPLPGPSPLIWVAACFSGALSMATQVAWTRVLQLVIGSTTYAFSAVLIVYLLALGVGSAWASRRGARLGRVAGALTIAHALFAVTMAAATYAVNALPYWYLGLSARWEPATLAGMFVVQVAILGSVLAVPVICAGTVLPLAIAAVVPPSAHGTGPVVGRIYAANTVGAIVGALGTGFVLIPRLGSQATLLGVCLVAALLACAFAFWAARPRWLTALAVASLLVVAVAVYRPPVWNHLELHAGVSEPERLSGIVDSLTQAGEQVLFHREGPTASVLVARRPSGRINMVINARVNASDTATDMATQVLLAQLPLLLAPSARDLFVIGWGSGVTAGSALLWPATRVTAVEIEPAVIEGSRLFTHVNYDSLNNPRLRLYEDDARHILLAADETYDVIISEPAHPWVTGIANLFTRDFYQLAARRLRPDGIFTQWVQAYQISGESFRSIIAAFVAVFPEVLVFRPPNESDVILVGTRGPRPLDLETIARGWQAEPVRADLARIGLERPEDLLASFYLGPQPVQGLSRRAIVNTDDRMYVELNGPRELVAGGSETGVIFGALKRLATPIEQMLADPAALLDRPERLEAYVAALEARERPTERYAARLRQIR